VSQCITDCLYGALGTMAAAQGTMNNFTFGNDAGVNYYETICGGTGAGQAYDGCDAVHSHMTNTRLTDPEVSLGTRRDGGYLHGGVAKIKGKALFLCFSFLRKMPTIRY
jgi:hypothetical protein